MPPVRQHPSIAPRRLLVIAIAAACAAMDRPAAAQDAGDEPGAAIRTVVVTGIRASMETALDGKRGANGIVEGIVADDIGKFPDTNLAEALQRIPGVSIDRSNGEGQRVTVRGIDPEWNLVLLNGRSMPSVSLSDSGSRSFDFSNLAAEAVSQVQVYKSARADTPAGGIGATLNIMTSRPLDLGNQASVGAKIAYDTSNTNLPDALRGRKVTPEVSFLLSRTFGAQGMFGVSLTGSYQSRNAGAAFAQVPNGYLGPFAGLDDPMSYIGATGVTGIAPGQSFDVPQNVGYSLAGTRRQRTNAQLTLQFRPVRDWTATVDYTLARKREQSRQNSLNVWFQGGRYTSGGTFVDGPVQTAAAYSETYGAADVKDLAVSAQDAGTVATLRSAGFNTQYRANPRLTLSLDLHHSTSRAGRDSPYGTANSLSAASFGRLGNTVDLTREMPVLQMDYRPAPFQVSGAWFEDLAIRETIDQVQAAGSLKLGAASTLDFGLAHTATRLASAYQQVRENAWTGTVTDPSQAPLYYDQRAFTPIDYTRYFGKLGGASDPKLFSTMWLVDFAKARQDAIDFTSSDGPDVNHAQQPDFTGVFSPSLAQPQTVRALRERNRALYGQLGTDWDTALPMHTGVGLRYEDSTLETNWTSLYPVGVSWSSPDLMPITLSATAAPQARTVRYRHWLPALDWDMDLTPHVKLRASWSVSIGRPRWDQIQGGGMVAPFATVMGLQGYAGNPDLRPVRSNNLDLSAEWYYGKRSAVSLGLFDKRLTGFPGSGIVASTLDTATTPVGGAYWKAAVAGGCGSDTLCIRDYILARFDGQPGVVSTGLQPNGHYGGAIAGIAGDPGLPLQVRTTVNAKRSSVRGAELAWQHMFDNGFGVQANYTYVDSGLKYDNAAPGISADNVAQFAMAGAANSANLVGVYEDDRASVRLAWNWRGEFLYTLGAFGNAQPGYTEAYGQVDLSASYRLGRNLWLSLEAVNLADATQRLHGRTRNEVLAVARYGPRYLLGARYKF